jgi:PAS domain S-box-containing protein
MIIGDQPLGVTILTTSRTPGDFSQQDLKLLYFAVSHAAIAIQNALNTREISLTRDFLSNLLENAGDIIFSLDQHGRFNYVNPRIEELGYKKEDLLEKHFKTIFPKINAENRINATLKQGSRQVFDITMDIEGVRRQNYTLNLVPTKGAEDQRNGALGIMRNVSEISRLQKKLLESERLAAYTQTVITLNHEINNPLTTVLGNLYLLEKDVRKLKKKNLTHRLNIIQENCERIQNVIKKLEKIDELKTVSYLGETKMVDIGDNEKTDRSE